MNMKNREPSFNGKLNLLPVNQINEEYRQDNFLFDSEECAKILDYKEFFECKFTKITFTKHIRRAMFTDVIFENCDFSNIDMRECVFHRVIFRKCRLTGTDFTRGTFEDVLVEKTQAQYACFSSSKIKNSGFIDDVLSDTGFSMCKIDNTATEECDFSRAEFYDTKLKNLDFTRCNISNIVVEASDIKGVIVNEEQAIAFAKLLGIVVK